jgi:co-chaperonin GroES (HSP10)
MNSAGIRPVGEQVLVLPDPVAQETESGLVVMTDKELDRLELGQTEGDVVEIAKGVKDAEYGPGDRVIFRKYSGLLMDGADGQRYRLVEKKDVVGVFEGE